MSNIYDVAREAGVSTATVSRVFTAPHMIKPQTMQRVLDAAQLVDYRPSRVRDLRNRGLRNAHGPIDPRRSAVQNAVGFQFCAAGTHDPIGRNAFYGPVLHGAQMQASALGMHMLLHTTNREELAQSMPQMIEEQIIAGLLLVGGADPSILSKFSQFVPNIVLVDNRDSSGVFESVVSDGFGGICAAMQYLMSLGHGDGIAFLLPDTSSATMQDRLHGYVCSLLDAGISPDPRMLMTKPHLNDEDIPAQLRACFQSERRLTAVICANDHFAHSLMRVCRDFGLRVPQDISIIGFDDIAYSSHCDPPLTTIRVDKEDLGRLAMRCLYARIHANPNDFQSPERHELPVKLIIRDSCGPPVA